MNRVQKHRILKSITRHFTRLEEIEKKLKDTNAPVSISRHVEQLKPIYREMYDNVKAAKSEKA